VGLVNYVMLSLYGCLIHYFNGLMLYRFLCTNVVWTKLCLKTSPCILYIFHICISNLYVMSMNEVMLLGLSHFSSFVE
jgi:hypothetical protein